MQYGPEGAWLPHTFGDHERWWHRRLASGAQRGVRGRHPLRYKDRMTPAHPGMGRMTPTPPARVAAGGRRRVWIVLEVAQCSDT